jgi:hypothetical protein
MEASVDFTHVTVANRALVEIRARPIESLDGEDERSVQVKSAYWTMIDHLLTLRKWHFARRLSRLTAAPASVDRQGWTFAHLMPSDRLGPPIKLLVDPLDAQGLRVFELTETAILSDAETLFGLFLRRAEPANWPGYFRSLAVTAVAARLADTIRNDDAMAAKKLAEAFGTPSMLGQGGLLKLAGDLDHAARPPEEFSAGEAFAGPRERNGDYGYVMTF